MDFTSLLMSNIEELVILGVQASCAALAEEEIALRGDKHGIRDRGGNFRSKNYARIRVCISIAVIAFIVQVVPLIMKNLFSNVVVQGLGVLIILSNLLLHIVVDSWSMKKQDILVFVTGTVLIVFFQFV